METLIISFVVQVLIENDNHVDFKNRYNWLYLACALCQFLFVMRGHPQFFLFSELPCRLGRLFSGEETKTAPV